MHDGMYSADVLIANYKTGERVFYDIFFIKNKIGNVNSDASQNETVSDTMPTKEIISNSGDKVNNNLEAEINQSMTMAQAENMIQRAFVLGNISNFYDGKYKNGNERLQVREDSEERQRALDAAAEKIRAQRENGEVHDEEFWRRISQKVKDEMGISHVSDGLMKENPEAAKAARENEDSLRRILNEQYGEEGY